MVQLCNPYCWIEIIYMLRNSTETFHIKMCHRMPFISSCINVSSQKIGWTHLYDVNFIEYRVFEGVIKVKWDVRMGSNPVRLVFDKGKFGNRNIYRENATGEDPCGEWLGSNPSLCLTGISPTHSLSLDFDPPQLWVIKLCLVLTSSEQHWAVCKL